MMMMMGTTTTTMITTNIFATLLIFSTLLSPVLCNDKIVRLYNVPDFINFANAVNSGTSYKKTTVLLENALDFSGYEGKLNPVGISETNSFAGTFDGQGYWIMSLKLNVTNGCAGLFGFTAGATIKNLVFSANNIINAFGDGSDTTDSKIYAGSIVGYCERVENHCQVENSVNLANVTFTGKSNGKVYVGGIMGSIFSMHESHIRNCANYGLIASYGKSKFVSIGGIISYFNGYQTIIGSVNNCLNLGPIYFNSKYVDSWYVGGIVGQSEYCTYDNCVSAGKIITTEKKSSTIGSLCGKSTSTTFKNCYWNEELGDITDETKIDECASYNSSFILNSIVSAVNYTGDNLLEALNTAVDHYVLYEYSRWGYSIGLRDMEFVVNSRSKHFYPDSQLFLLPGLSGDGSLSFDGWYTDEACTTHLTKYIFTENTTIYGRWAKSVNTYTVSFDMQGGSPAVDPITGSFDTKITLPSEVSKENCEFGWWENDYGDEIGWEFNIPAHDVTLHAVWACEKIRTARDLIGMAKVVNSDKTFKYNFVTFENDIVFTDSESRQFKPIGNVDTKYFEGVFDGCGHTISNLKLKTTSFIYGGILGYSKGTTIRNLVMDSTCSVVSTYGSSSLRNDQSFFGAFIGYCETYNRNCTVENSVNMASITFNGYSGSNVFVGGLVGYFVIKRNYISSIVNCANYGTVTDSCENSIYTFVGGLLGGCNGGSKGAFIYNNINYGVTSNKGKSNYPCFGGIVGYSVEKVSYENCVSVGEIVTRLGQSADDVGAIVGDIYSGSTIRNCYWNEVFGNNAVGFVESEFDIDNSSCFDNKTFELASTTTVGGHKGTSLINALNKYAELSSDVNCSRWALNKNMSTITFMIDNRVAPFLTLNSRIILIPNITSVGDGTFLGWFTDPKYTKHFDSAEITEDTTLYGYISKKSEENQEKSNASEYVFIICFVVISIACVIIVVGFLLWNKFGYKVKVKKEIHELMEPMLLDMPANSIEFLDLYPADYKYVTLKKALVNAGMEPDKAESLSATCYRHADNLLETKKLPKGVTLDDAAAIALYTMETSDMKLKPYKLINEALMKGELKALESVKDLLCLVMRALRKMPIVYNKPLYRGVRSDAPNENKPDVEGNNELNSSSDSFDVTGLSSADKRNSFRKERGLYNGDDYVEGDEISWSALSSTSSDVAATKEFLAKGTKSKKAEGTLFIIENGWGYNVQPCSMFPGEEEIILEPERRFKVKAVIPGEGLTIVKMEMLRTPTVLPDVFGETRGKAAKKSNTVAQTGKTGNRYNRWKRSSMYNDDKNKL